jgi:ribonuclease HI
VVLRRDGAVLGRRAVCVGQGCTNNQAEYVGAWHALEAGLSVEGERELEIRGDSMLVIRQVTGDWRINEPTLYRLCMAVRRLLETAEERGLAVRWTHVRREFNGEADALAREGAALRDPSKAQLPLLLSSTRD